MSSKQSLSIIAGLILLNIVTVLYFIMGTDKKENKTEVVASVGNKEITRANWIDKLEAMHGKEVLKAMINEEVILQMVKEHELTVSDNELKVESVVQQVLYGIGGSTSSKDLKFFVLIEKLLTKDVIITDQEAELYYQDNKSLQDLSDLYHLSHIVVPNVGEAKTVIKELKADAEFADVALKRSMDRYTADKGGDLEYLSLESEAIPEEYKDAAKTLKAGYWSQPVKTKEGYAILYLHDRVDKSELTFNKIKPVLKRKIAMEQMNMPVSAEIFWEKLNVDWIYGK